MKPTEGTNESRDDGERPDERAVRRVGVPGWVQTLLVFLLGSTMLDMLRMRRDVARVPPGLLERYTPEADPRRMSACELRRIPGVGIGRARSIVRNRRGARAADANFVWEDLPGIGATTARSIRAWERDTGGADPLTGRPP